MSSSRNTSAKYTRSRSVSFNSAMEMASFGTGTSEPPIEEDKSTNYFLRHQEAAPPKIVVKSTLNPVMAKLFSSILRECAVQLEMMAATNRLPETDVDLEFISPYAKYKDNVLVFDDDMLYNEWWQVDYKKFKKDVWYLQKIARLTADSLKEDRNFDIFKKTITAYDHTKQEEDVLLSSKLFNLNELKKLRLSEEGEKQQLLADLALITKNMFEQKNYYSDVCWESLLKSHVMQKYESARREMNSYLLKESEDRYKNTTEDHNTKIEEESLIHDEISNFIENLDAEYHEEILLWMNKYDEDFDNLEIEINKQRLGLENMQEKHAQLKEEFENRTVEIAEYLEHKRIKKLEAEELERRTWAATKIQAWWRGVMYRKKLGPYRKKKGKKGKDKKGAKGKKNKK